MSPTDRVTAKLIEHVVNHRFDTLSPSAVTATSTFVLDSLGVALAGSRVPLVTGLIDIAHGWGQSTDCRIWGTGQRVPAVTAAFVNGYQIHNQEWDCVHEPAVVHPMAVVLSTLLAWSEQRGQIDGRRFVSGCSVAVDVATTIGRAAKNKLRFFRPAMCGALGATAGIANILRLDVETTRSALGLCYSQLSGTMQAHVEGSPMLPLQIGVNTRAALLAIDLACRGIQGPRDFLEGDFGYFALFDSDWDASAFDQLGLRSEIEHLSHKPFPSGRATHGGVDGALTLQQTLGFSVAEIEELRVYAPPLVVQLVDRPAHPDMLPAYARLCLPYVVATALLTGDVTVGDFDAAALRSRDRLTLAHRIRVLRDDNPSLNALAPQRVEVQLRSGRTEQLPLRAVLGAPGRPLTRERHLAKFRRAATAGLKPLSEQSISKLIHLIDELPAISDMTQLVDAMLFEDAQ
ncbi:MAG: MmgE/PrpD family protein [Steroidobacteraceae bacterium]